MSTEQTTAANDNPCCSLCKGPHPYDVSIPSTLWNRTIREAGLPDYLCATCILRAFVKAKQPFSATLWGDGMNLFNGDEIYVEVNGLTPTISAEEADSLRRFAEEQAATIVRLEQEKQALQEFANERQTLLNMHAMDAVNAQHELAALTAQLQQVREWLDASQNEPEQNGYDAAKDEVRAIILATEQS